ncbi:fructosamine kinase family protein [Plebeiibacterium sediminum]|uniref:Fructosamine kinase family protein n=1 Tax=Plebeiibacterium sediminum TaxID=2992112 RepID=A0AAE3SEX5_9BACT|nr:fructosamine kinase family protein [Plebeiobacterium sediminum]MCW3786661.1 fructosamine kinase family protein [Plebeiobacterium sediminum]
MSNRILKIISEFLGERIISSQSIGGGCIAQSGKVITDKGNLYFLKQGYDNGMFECEANGLKEIAKADCIETPNVILVDKDFLLLELIPQGVKNFRSMKEFGKDLARMHQFTSNMYGFMEDNFIGTSIQYNSYSSNWTEFYFQNRLLFQYRLSEANGNVTKEFKNLFLKIESEISNILDGSEDTASLLHGDLWAGNYMINNEGNAVLIDPAVYYGNREADLAMTKLFGGFNEEFYEAYNNEYPLTKDYKYRENIYLLYHVMNHYNLFGNSYYGQMIDLMNSYIKKGN